MARVEIDQQNASAEAGLSGSKWTDVQLARRALSLSNRNSRVIMRHFLADENAPDHSVELRRQDNTARISKIIGKLGARCTSAKEKRLLAKIRETRELYASNYLEVLRLLFDGNDRIRADRLMAAEVSQGLLRYHADWTHFIDAALQQMVRLRTQDLLLANQRLQREIVEHEKTENHRHLKTSALKAAQRDKAWATAHMAL